MSKETYGQAARERDLLKAGIELALPELERVKLFIAYGAYGYGDRIEAQRALERAVHDLTVGVS